MQSSNTVTTQSQTTCHPTEPTSLKRKKSESDEHGTVVESKVGGGQLKKSAATPSGNKTSVVSTSKGKFKGKTKERGIATGRWTEEEHALFLEGLRRFPYRAWKKIATLIETRTVVQIRTHAQKYYQKIAKEQANRDAMVASKLRSSESSGPRNGVTDNDTKQDAMKAIPHSDVDETHVNKKRKITAPTDNGTLKENVATRDPSNALVSSQPRPAAHTTTSFEGLTIEVPTDKGFDEGSPTGINELSFLGFSEISPIEDGVSLPESFEGGQDTLDWLDNVTYTSDGGTKSSTSLSDNILLTSSVSSYDAMVSSPSSSSSVFSSSPEPQSPEFCHDFDLFHMDTLPDIEPLVAQDYQVSYPDEADMFSLQILM